MIIIPLAPHHDRKGFDCGEDKVNQFLKERARKQAELGVCRTSVAVESYEDTVIQGYHATLVKSLTREEVPASKKLPPQDVPVLLLAWLGVDKNFQNQKRGSLLIYDVLNRARIIAEQTALHGVILDALNPEAERLYLRLGFVHLKDKPHGLFMPTDTVIATLKMLEGGDA